MWQEKETQLYRSFQFPDFKEAFAFMTKVALVAEKLDHHPNWINEYNKVDIYLSTHSAGGIITDKDRELARLIDTLYKP